MTTARQTASEHGTFVLTRYEHRIEFVCDRCLQPKVTRLDVIWTNPAGSRKRICNGCYGRLMSGIPL